MPATQTSYMKTPQLLGSLDFFCLEFGRKASDESRLLLLTRYLSLAALRT